MNLMQMNRFGANISGNTVSFGFLLPQISSNTGHKVFVKIIHENDQFIQGIPPKKFEMTHSIDPDYGDYWSANVTIDPEDNPCDEYSMPGICTPHKEKENRCFDSNWGSDGKYIYRYSIESTDKGCIDFISDPFATNSSVGTISIYKGKK